MAGRRRTYFVEPSADKAQTEAKVAVEAVAVLLGDKDADAVGNVAMLARVY